MKTTHPVDVWDPPTREGRLETVSIPARVDRYSLLVERNRFLRLIVLILAAALTVSSALSFRLHSGFEVQTGYFLLTEDGLLALSQAQKIDRRTANVVAGFIEMFALEAFRVEKDLGEVREKQRLSAYRTMGAARERLNNFYDAERNPFKILNTKGSVEIARPSIKVLPSKGEDGETSLHSWYVEFVEVVFREGKRPQRFKVVLTVTVSFEGDERTKTEVNPFGIWVDWMHMERTKVEFGHDDD